MILAKKYIEKHLINLHNEVFCMVHNTRYFIVIPCYNEPDILNTLHSVNNCKKSNENFHVLIVINSAEDAPSEVLLQNNKTITELNKAKEEHKFQNISFSWISLKDIAKKQAGAGFARKSGMDQVVAYCSKSNINDPVLVSLDADSEVAPNYLQDIGNTFNKSPKLEACSIYFEHPLKGNLFSEKIYNAIATYELYLRYYKQAIQSTGFKNFYHTIGSCFAVRVSAYLKYGGMNKKQAGEDFYFLQKIIPNGNFLELNSTCVYPSPRPSDRVPFGTGPVVKQIANSDSPEYLTYNYDAFKLLKCFFDKTESLFKADISRLNQFLNIQEKPLKQFLEGNNFISAINEINSNVASKSSFTKRFFNWFDAFKILKYLNYTHQEFYKKEDLKTGVNKLLNNDINKPDSSDYFKLLLLFRERDLKKIINKV